MEISQWTNKWQSVDILTIIAWLSWLFHNIENKSLNSNTAVCPTTGESPKIDKINVDWWKLTVHILSNYCLNCIKRLYYLDSEWSAFLYFVEWYNHTRLNIARFSRKEISVLDCQQQRKMSLDLSEVQFSEHQKIQALWRCMSSSDCHPAWQWHLSDPKQHWTKLLLFLLANKKRLNKYWIVTQITIISLKDWTMNEKVSLGVIKKSK